MKVLMITGDRRFGPGNPRFELQKSAVDELAVLYWGRGQFFPKIPKGAFDVVTAQDPLWRGLVGLFVAWKIGAKCNVQVHMDLSSLSFFKHILANIVLRHADTVRVVSERIKAQVVAFGVEVKISILPVFVDLQKFRSSRRRGHAGKHILWIGRFEEEKNPLQTIEVLKEVLNVVPEAHVTMLGSGSLDEELVARGAGLQIVFPGWRDPVEFLEVADVVLCTSFYEAWGSSIVEALAAGVPVVAPDVGIAREAGAIVVPRNELAFAVVTVVREGTKGHLALHMPGAEEWKEQWLKTL